MVKVMSLPVHGGDGGPFRIGKRLPPRIAICTELIGIFKQMPHVVAGEELRMGISEAGIDIGNIEVQAIFLR